MAGDGTSHTIYAVETSEQDYARWTFGNETIIYGLGDDWRTGGTTLSYAAVTAGSRTYAAPTGYAVNNFWADSTANGTTFMQDDPNAPNYVDWAEGGATAGTAKIGGMGSHAGVTNHLLCDGSVQSIGSDMDTAAYHFLITRDGGEPFPPLEPN